MRSFVRILPLDLRHAPEAARADGQWFIPPPFPACINSTGAKCTRERRQPMPEPPQPYRTRVWRP